MGQEAGASVDVPNLDAPQRSPVAPPEVESSAGPDVNLPINSVSAATAKISRQNRPSVRFRLGRPSSKIPDQQRKKGRLAATRTSPPKTSRQTQPRTSSIDHDLEAITSVTPTSQTEDSQRPPSALNPPSTDTHSPESTAADERQESQANDFLSAQSHLPSADTGPAASPALIKKRKMNLIQSDAVTSLREFISGKERTYERPSKRRKDQHSPTSQPEVSIASTSPVARPARVFKRKRNTGQSELTESISRREKTDKPPFKRFKDRHTSLSTTNVGAEVASAPQGETTIITLDSQEVVPSNASIRPVLQQRSPVHAPDSSSGSPVGDIGDEPQRDAEPEEPQYSRDMGHLQDEAVSPPAHTLGLDSTERDQEFHEVETFAETRTRSPGLTYNDDDWGTSYRSPVATPESEL